MNTLKLRILLILHLSAIVCCVCPSAGQSPAITAAGACIYTEKGEVVLLERSERMQYGPGQIDTPGGRRERGETPQQTAENEVLEETNLCISLQESPYVVNEEYQMFFAEISKRDVPMIKLSKEHNFYTLVPINVLRTALASRAGAPTMRVSEIFDRQGRRISRGRDITIWRHTAAALREAERQGILDIIAANSDEEDYQVGFDEDIVLGTGWPGEIGTRRPPLHRRPSGPEPSPHVPTPPNVVPPKRVPLYAGVPLGAGWPVRTKPLPDAPLGRPDRAPATGRATRPHEPAPTTHTVTTRRTGLSAIRSVRPAVETSPTLRHRRKR